MTVNEIKEILKKHEGLQLEYKTSSNKLPKDFWKTYSSFGNTNGGYVILGINEDDNRNAVIVGVNDPNKIKTDLFTSTSDKTKVNVDLLQTKNVNIIEIDDKKIISIYIPEASIQQKPIFLNNTLELSYIRKHDGDFRASNDELGSLIRNKSDSLDSELLNGYTIDDLDIESIIKYQSILHKRNPTQDFISMPPEKFLIEIGVFQYDYSDNRILKLTLGGLLFFGKYNAIVSRIPHYHVDFFDKRGTNERWTDRIYSGDLDLPDLNLFNYYTIVLEKLLTSIERPFKLDKNMARKTYSELNVALREMFVNMITHADYLSNTTALIVEIHMPYYLFVNPGIMKIPINSFFKGSHSSPRNNILVRLFTRMGAAERAGSGSQKILNVIVKNKFKEPEINTSLEKTIFKLWIANVIDVTPNLSEIEKNIYALLSDESNDNYIALTAKQIESNLHNYSSFQIGRALRSLAAKNIIQKMGGNRNRTYTRQPSCLEVIKNIDMASRMVKDELMK